MIKNGELVKLIMTEPNNWRNVVTVCWIKEWMNWDHSNFHHRFKINCSSNINTCGLIFKNKAKNGGSYMNFTCNKTTQLDTHTVPISNS